MNEKTTEILNRIRQTETEREKVWETYGKLSGELNELRDELCDNISFEDLRPMVKDDIVVGQRVFGKNQNGFHTFVIEEILGYDDVDFKAYIANGSSYGIFEKYILKD